MQPNDFEILPAAAFAQEMGGDAINSVSYTITVEQYDKAFRAFQKKYVYPRNAVITAIFTLLAALYAEQVFRSPTYTLGWIIMAFCMAMIFIVWFNPYKIRRTLMKSISQIQDDVYTTSFFPDGLVIQTQINDTSSPSPSPSPSDDNTHTLPLDEDSGLDLDADLEDELMAIPPKKILFHLDAPEIIDNITDKMFIVYLKKQMFYVVPHDAFDGNTIEDTRKLFKDSLQKKYFVRQ